MNWIDDAKAKAEAEGKVWACPHCAEKVYTTCHHDGIDFHAELMTPEDREARRLDYMRKYGESEDSRPDTYEHIGQVRGLVLGAAQELTERAHRHDASKLRDPERDTFDEVTPMLRELTYGSPEYEEVRAHMGTALEHHYQHNDHHPEHFKNGVHDMNLIQLLEMLCDWIAATRRHDDGNMECLRAPRRGRAGSSPVPRRRWYSCWPAGMPLP